MPCCAMLVWQCVQGKITLIPQFITFSECFSNKQSWNFINIFFFFQNLVVHIFPEVGKQTVNGVQHLANCRRKLILIVTTECVTSSESSSRACSRSNDSDVIGTIAPPYGKPTLNDRPRIDKLEAGCRAYGPRSLPRRSVPSCCQKPILPAAVTDQIRLWELERDRFTFSDGVLYNQFLSQTDFELLRNYAKVSRRPGRCRAARCIHSHGTDPIRK